jgi:hypothetical protein
MPGADVALDGAPSASPTSTKLRRLLRKRLRQLSRIVLVLAIGLAIAGTALAIWWLTSLDGLPDIGDPFDVAALRAFSIPDDQDAFAFFRRANERRGRFPLAPGDEAPAATGAWSEADSKVRAWAEANRPALDLFLRGAGCADGISRRPGEPYSGRYSDELGPRYLILLALLEGGRRAEGGDMAGCWDCYHAVLRATVHSMRRGAITERYFTALHHGWLRKRVQAWAADPRTTIPQLRRALQEAIESRPRLEWHAFSLKVEYLDWMRDLERTRHPVFYAIQEESTYRIGDMELPQNLAVQLYHARRFLLREPERSRRAIRLLFANWIAHAEIPEPGPRKATVTASFRGANRTDSVLLYPVGPAAPDGARALPAQEVASWLASAYDIKVIAWNRLWPSVRLKEQAGYRELVVALAGELYRRERGMVPPTQEALVGTYLERLPDDGLDEFYGETAPIAPDEPAPTRPPAK